MIPRILKTVFLKNTLFLFVPLLGVTLSSCSEMNYPEQVASGVARLSVNNFARLVGAINNVASVTKSSECIFSPSAPFAGKTTIERGENGLGKVSFHFAQCEFDFGTGTTINLPGSCSDQKVTYFGKVTVSGSRTISGLLTGNAEHPVIPSGNDGIDFKFTSVEFENYKVESSDLDKSMTILRGSAAFDAKVHLAKDQKSKFCAVALPNLTLSHIKYSPEPGSEDTVVKLNGPRGDFEAVINSSDFNAQIGVHGEVSNSLDGVMTIWGKQIAIPTDGNQLKPGFTAQSYNDSLACIENLKTPTEVCAYEPELALPIARLTVSNLGSLLRELVEAGRASKNGNPSCSLSSFNHSPSETNKIDENSSEVIWNFDGCVYEFGSNSDEKSPFSGTVTLSGRKSIHGRPTDSLLFPVMPQTNEIKIHFTEVIFDNFRVNSSKAPAVLTQSGSLSFDLVAHLGTQKLGDKEIPWLPLLNLTFSNIHHIGENNLVISLQPGEKENNFKLPQHGDFHFTVQDSDLQAQVGKFKDKENQLSGKIKMFGQWIDFGAKEQLDPEYDASKWSQSWQPRQVDISEDPPSESFETDARSFLADLVNPISKEGQSKQEQFKNTLVKHSDALYWMIHRPDLVNAAGIPRELDSWLEPFAAQFKEFSRPLLKEALLAADVEDFVVHQAAIEDGINKLEIEGCHAHIDVPEALGKDFKLFMETINAQYFLNLDAVDKRRVLGHVLKVTNATSTPDDKFLAAAQVSGPFFQKLMQILSDKMPKGSLKDALTSLKNRLPRIEQEDLQKYLLVLEAEGVQIKIIKSLGAASVGEALLAEQTIKTNNGYETRKIVIKFKRPGVEEIAIRENAFFKAQASKVSPTMRESYDQISKHVFDELDFEKELQNLIKGYQVYNSENGPISVVKSLEGFPKSKFWIAMEMAEGKTFEDARGAGYDNPEAALISKLELMSKAVLLDRLTTEFIQKGLLVEGDAFIHGDLHGGNKLIAIDESAIEWLREHNISAENISRKTVEALLKTKNKANKPMIQLILVDFGNSHVLPKAKRLALFNMLIAVSDVSLSPMAFLSAFENLSDSAKLDKVLLSKGLEPIFNDDEMTFTVKFGKAIDLLQQNKVSVPGLLTAFFKSMTSIDNSYNLVREDAKAQGFCFERLKLVNPLIDEIVSSLIGKMPMNPSPFLSFVPNGFFPDNLSPENVVAIRRKLPWYIFDYYLGRPYVIPALNYVWLSSVVKSFWGSFGKQKLEETPAADCKFTY